MSNLYWNVYKNLEKELLGLADEIHIDDDQLSVYSMKIADLLMRTAVEVESISKALYIREGGVKPDDSKLYFDSDCLKFLNGKWALSEKVVMVSSPYLYFEKDENKILTPLHKAHKRGSSSSDWQKAYQAVKHNREDELKKGNLKHFIRALASLYILNLYYLDRTFDLGKECKTSAFDTSIGSSVFSVKVYSFPGVISTGEYFRGKDFEKCTYLIQAINTTLRKFIEFTQHLEEQSKERLTQMLQESNSGIEPTKIQEKYNDIFRQFRQDNVREFSRLWNSMQYEAVLNKNQH